MANIIVKRVFALVILGLIFPLSAYSEEVKSEGKMVVESVLEGADTATATVMIVDDSSKLDEEQRGMAETNWTWRLQCKWNGNRLELRTWNRTSRSYNCSAKCNYPRGHTDFSGANPANANNFLMAWVSQSNTGNLRISDYSCSR